MGELDGAPDVATLIEAYYDAGWTDGLPVMPPTEASIAAMLAGAGLRGDEVVGEIAGRNAVVTAEKLAINAVLAGCRPEYAPVVAAAVRALCAPDFAYHPLRGGSGSIAATTRSARAIGPMPRSGARSGS